MAITAKPFTVSEKIARSVFAGDPSIFAAQDLNRQLDASHQALIDLLNNFGFVREGWDCSLSLVDGGAGVDIIHTYSIAADGSGKPPIVYSKGVALSIPLGDVVKDLFDPENYSVLWLVATRKLITFSDDPVMSGINSSEYPSSVPSSDTWVWDDERLEITSYDATPTLTGDEELIGIVVSNNWNYYHTNPVKNRMNATKFSELIETLNIPGNITGSNSAAVDLITIITERLLVAETNITAIDGRVTQNESDIADHESRLDVVEPIITANAASIAILETTLGWTSFVFGTYNNFECYLYRQTKPNGEIWVKGNFVAKATIGANQISLPPEDLDATAVLNAPSFNPTTLEYEVTVYLIEGTQAVSMHHPAVTDGDQFILHPVRVF